MSEETKADLPLRLPLDRPLPENTVLIIIIDDDGTRSEYFWGPDGWHLHRRIAPQDQLE